MLSVHPSAEEAGSAAELRGAAYLRAISFYSYPEGRSEFAARSHRRMKADAEWEAVTAKVQGRDEAYKELDVTCFIATVEDDVDPGDAAAGVGGAVAGSRSELLAELRSSLDASAQLPAETAAATGGSGGVGGAGCSGADGAQPGRRRRRLVVGSLDLNVGAALPSEELIGRLPQADPRTRRAYLSNVCVAPAARRLGVARALLRAAEAAAAGKGVEQLYVHVVADNAPAVGLYCGSMGFQVEQTESEGFARSLQRPRRLLLAKQLVR
ncbi:hypothetical protein GPECTOR_88g445 [Gonium pectorale]|uniref:N-acetyltransferase domain-containing protein n=1 Tax=Gonium pectorale TaxID=33097 RepID=A0A150G0X7_GONPE|nr:hypothetical protein GPECTOR_88g445 [Gonium pectorale]|eukprot:KXZ43502.1 hypothetical protein GPECTOR_88g445 [Gonium pectorale]